MFNVESVVMKNLNVLVTGADGFIGSHLVEMLSSHLRSEAFDISLLEGAMHGKPLISSEIGTGNLY